MEMNVQSVQGAPPTLSPHKSLPRKRPAVVGTALPAPAVRLPRSMPGDLATESPDAGRQSQSPLGSPILLEGEGILPPTPPPTGRERMSKASFGHESGLPDSNGSIRALSSRHSGLSTPTTARSPPTPDITPPSEQHLRPPLPSSSVSVAASQAESFQTAREEQPDESSDDDRYSNYTLAGTRNASTRAYMEATKALQHGDRGLGFSFESEDGDSTPTQEHQRQLDAPLLLPKLRGQGASLKTAIDKALAGRDDDGDEDTWDRDHTRNVTLRPKKQPRTPPGQQQHPSSPPQSRSHKRTVSQTQRSPATEAVHSLQSSPRHAAPPKMEAVSTRVFSEPSHIMHRSNRSVASKRLSDVSNGSTVVEAVIRVTTPQAASRRLRHVSKVAGLRSFSGSAINLASGSPRSISQPDRGSVSSDGPPPQHKLHHKRASISERREKDVLDGDQLGEPAMPVLKRPLRHSRDYSHLRPSTGSSTGSVVMRGDDSPHKVRKVAAPESLGLQENAREIGRVQPVDRSIEKAINSPLTGPEDRKSSAFPAAPDVIAGAGHPVESAFSGTDSSVAAERNSWDPPAEQKPAQRKSALKSRPDKLELGPFPYSQQPPSPTRNRAQSTSTVESQQRLLPVVPLQMQQHARAMRARHSSNPTEPNETSRGVNFGDDGRVPDDAFEYTTNRDEARRSTALALEEPLSSPAYSSLYPPVTPLSMSSMRSDAQIVEAQAISFFPHTNESLLFIQHGSAAGLAPDQDMHAYPRLNGSPVMPAELHRAIDAIENPSTPTPPPTRITTTAETEDILHLTPPSSTTNLQAPQLLVEPSTPTTATAAPAEVDSPLRNPRSAPQPPAFKVIPPTPFSEIEDPLAAAQALQSAQAPRPPARRISLMQRARRYSDSFLQPLFVRTVSVKRVMRPATGDEAATRDRNLHPQWRPRGFWDDFSDSESEDDDWFGDGEYVVDSDDLDRPPRRLPRGGDTSDVRSLEQEQERTAMSAGSPAAVGRMGSVKKVIMDSFRGSGGFLIGNSLGVERAGTNRRRHHISLPTRLQARYAPNRGVATLPAHVTERYGAAGAAHHFVARQQQVEQQQRQQDGQQAILQDVQANGTIPRSAENGFTHNPTQPLSLRSVPRSNAKRGPSRSKSLSSFRSYTTSATDASRGNPRGGWRRSGIRFPFRVEYVGIRGVAERMRERKAERRREELRRRIGRGYLQSVS